MVSTGFKNRPDILPENEADSLNPGVNPAEKVKGGDGGSIDDHSGLLENAGAYQAPQKTQVVGDEVVPKNFNEDAVDPKANINDVAAQETAGVGNGWHNNVEKPTNTPAPESRWGKLKAAGKNVGASGSIVGLLCGGGGALLVMLSPGILLIQMKEVLHNDGSTGARSSGVFSRALLGLRLGKGDCSKPGIRCKMSSMSKEQIKSYEKAGFKINGERVAADGSKKPYTTDDANKDPLKDGERIVTKSVTFPDAQKTVVTDGKGFFGVTRLKVDMRFAAFKAFNYKAAFFQNKAFTNIGKAYNFIKSKVLKPNTKEDPKATDKSFNDNTKLKDTAGNEEAAKKAKQNDGKDNETVQKTNSAADKMQANGKSAWSKSGNGLQAAVGVACMSYNYSRIAVSAVKLAKITALIAFAAEWWKLADQIKAQGTKGADPVDGNTVDHQVNKLTSYENNKELNQDEDIIQADGSTKHYKKGDANPKYNLSSTDSQGYRVAAQGDKSALKDFALKYMLGGAGALLVLSKFTTGLQKMAGHGNARTGKTVLRGICKGAGSPAILLAYGAFCVAQAFAGIEEFVTLLSAVVTCVVVPFVKAKAYGEVINQIATKIIIPAVVENLSYLNLGSDIKGVDAGNALAAGAGTLLGVSAANQGLEPSQSAEETQGYVAYTQKYEDDYTEVAKYEARDTPLDYTNKYSFLGSMVQSLDVTSTRGSPPVLAGIAGLFGLLPKSFATIGSNASALYSQPSFNQTDRYDCQDPDLLDIGIGTEGQIDKGGADKFCDVVPVMPIADLKTAEDQAQGNNKAIMDNIDWMSKEQKAPEKPTDKGKPVDDTGGTTDDSSGCKPHIGDLLAGIDSSQECVDKSEKSSIIPDDEATPDQPAGSPRPDSQYAKFVTFCTQRTLPGKDAPGDPEGTPDYWGTSSHGIEEGSTRDQKWFTGEQCMVNSKMMQEFRNYTAYCNQVATMDGTTHCWNDDTDQTVTAVTPSNCDGQPSTDTAAIYTCALTFDPFGYLYGGGHGDMPSTKTWWDDFKAHRPPDGKTILDCSGLVRIATYLATGVDTGPIVAGPGGYDNSNYQKISKEEAKQGDIIVGPGHVAIVHTNDPSGQKFTVFEASQDNGGDHHDDIKEGSYGYDGGGMGGIIGVYRFTGGGKSV